MTSENDILELINRYGHLLNISTEKLSPKESTIIFCINLFQQKGSLYLPIFNRNQLFLLDKYGHFYTRQPLTNNTNEQSTIWWEPFKSPTNIITQLINRELGF